MLDVLEGTCISDMTGDWGHAASRFLVARSSLELPFGEFLRLPTLLRLLRLNDEDNLYILLLVGEGDAWCRRGLSHLSGSQSRKLTR